MLNKKSYYKNFYAMEVGVSMEEHMNGMALCLYLFDYNDVILLPRRS